MRYLSWIPGIGHLRAGDRNRGIVLLILLVFFVGLAAWRAPRLATAVRTTFQRLFTEGSPYTLADFDLLLSTVFVAVAVFSLLLYAPISLRRLRSARSDDALRNRATSPWWIVWTQFRKNRLAVTGAWIIIALYLVAILCPLLAPYDPTEQGNRITERLLAPSFAHPLGTDRFARDVLSRIIYGSRISLLVGFLSVGIAVTIGTLYGSIAGYFGGWVDSVMMRFVDLMLSMPTLVLIITVIALWQSQSIWIIITVIGLMSWMGVARLVRGQFLVLKEREFFQAARALGARGGRLIFKHLLPNALTPIIVSSTLRVGNTILLEAGLSYLGLGVQPPTPSWGNIVYDTKQNIFTEWWMPLAAGTAVVITVVGYNLLGDGLRDALDPRLRQ